MRQSVAEAAAEIVAAWDAFESRTGSKLRVQMAVTALDEALQGAHRFECEDHGPIPTGRRCLSCDRTPRPVRP